MFECTVKEPWNCCKDETQQTAISGQGFVNRQVPKDIEKPVAFHFRASYFQEAFLFEMKESPYRLNTAAPTLEK